MNSALVDPSLPVTKPLRPAHLKEACVAEALAIIASEGLENLSLREVARRLGVSHQAPYKHFPSREHLVAELVRRAFDDLAAALEARPRFDDPQEDSTGQGRAYVEYALRYPVNYRLMFGAPLPNPANHPDMMRSARGAFAQLRDGLALVFKAHGAPPGHFDLDLEAMYVWTTMHGLVSVLQTRAVTHLGLGEEVLEALPEHILKRIGMSFGGPPATGRPAGPGSKSRG